jgi:uncharacterized membrane protein YkoI
MNKGIIAVVSFFLTAFVLVVGVSVVNASGKQNVAAAPVQDSALLQQMSEREAAYQSLIADANTRIQTLNQEVLTLSSGTPIVDAQASAAPAQAALAPEQAAQIALTEVNNEDSLIQLPELVDYQGAPAYEVRMTKGLLYIDATNGSVLFNSVPKQIDGTRAAEIAGEYLGGMDPRYAIVKVTQLNGSPIFEVNLNNYLVYIDPYGQIIKAQVIQYVDNSSTSSGSSSSSNSNNGSQSAPSTERESDDD